MTIGVVAGIALRKPLIVDVMRDKQLYRVTDDGEIENTYLLRLVNKDAKPHRYFISLRSSAPLELEVEHDHVNAAAEEVLTVPVTVEAPAGAVRGRTDLSFVVRDMDTGLQIVEESRFFGPVTP